MMVFMSKNNLNHLTALKDQAAQDYLDNWNDAPGITARLLDSQNAHYAIAAEYNPDRYAWPTNRPLRTAPLAAFTHLVHCELQEMFLQTQPGTLPEAREYIETPSIEGVSMFDPFKKEARTFTNTLYQLIANASEQVQERITSSNDPLNRYRGLWEAYLEGYDRVRHGRKLAGEATSVWPDAKGSLRIVWSDNCIVALESLTKFSPFNALTGTPTQSALYRQSLKDSEGIGMLANMRAHDGIKVLHTDRLSEHLYSDSSRFLIPADAHPFTKRGPDGNLQYSLKAFKEQGVIDRPGHCPVARPLTTPKDYASAIITNHTFNKLINAEAGTTVIEESSTRFSSATNLIRLGALIGPSTIFSVWPE